MQVNFVDKMAREFGDIYWIVTNIVAMQPFRSTNLQHQLSKTTWYNSALLVVIDMK